MSSNKSKKRALSLLTAAYEKKWNAPVGKRKCKFEISEKCLKTADEKDKQGRNNFRYHRCRCCHAEQARVLYHKRMARRKAESGYTPVKRGRPPAVVKKSKKSKRKSGTKGKGKSKSQKGKL